MPLLILLAGVYLLTKGTSLDAQDKKVAKQLIKDFAPSLKLYTTQSGVKAKASVRHLLFKW